MKQNNYHPLKKSKAGSETSFAINLFALMFAVGLLICCRFLGYRNEMFLFILFALLLTLGISMTEFFCFPQTCALRKWKILRKISWERIFYKEVTLLVTLECIGVMYWFFPMFSYNDFMDVYYPFLKIIVPILIICSLPYFCLMDKIDDDVEDIYYKIGYGIVHVKKTVSGFELGNYVRSWLIKAFWLSLMQPSMVDKIVWLLNITWENIKDRPVEWFWVANTCCFFIDLAYASVGYLINFKILNTHTRTAEPTLLGWMVAIMCYWPFWGVLFYPYFFRYDETGGWLNVFEIESFWWWTWFVTIIGLEFLYALATVAAGIRFSNLTYRGLWNTGPYKYTKHPAYVFKNISWWLISMPFMASNVWLAIKLSLMLFGVNVIYYLRAKTEERHLSHYPEYEEYALMMNEKSIFRGVAKILPFLKYRPLAESERIF